MNATNLTNRSWLHQLRAVTALLALAAMNASSATYEPFNYAIGSLPNGTATTASGFNGSWTCGGAGTIGSGLTYPNLPTTANAISSGTSRQFVNFSSPLSSGTEYISFLFKTTAGNPGANINGVYFPNGGTGLWFGLGLAPASSTQGRIGLGSMTTTSTAALGASSLSTSPGLQTYGSTYFIVLKIDFNTSGTKDTVAVYINPAAGVNAPDVAADQTISSFDVGTITGIGLNVQGATTLTIDEIRRGLTYGDVAGNSSAPLTAAITSPLADTVVSTTSFSIEATATITPGTVTNVDFYMDSLLVGSDSSSPFSYAVLGASAGAHALQAVAWDSDGNSVTSSVVNVTAANLPPTVSLTSPGNGSAFLSDTSVSLAAAATDDGAVTSVDFYVDGTLVGSDTTSPYTATWTNPTLGAHALTCVAWDNDGLSTTSAVVNITGLTTFAAYEPFNYASGSLANGTPATGSGFSGNWTCGGAGTIGTGMTYTDLPTTANALSSGGSRQYVNFTAPLSSGTEYISFIFKTTPGNPGGNINGVYFPNGGTGLWFGLGLAPASSTQGRTGLGSMLTTGTSAQGASSLSTSPNLQTYGSTYFIVLKIDFNTSGTQDTVAVYINPAAGTDAPGISADQTLSSFDVGTISGIGLNVQGATTLTIDEIRRGSTYADVAGFNTGSPEPTIPTSIAISAAQGQQVSWSASSANTYQPQKSADNTTWVNLGSLLSGSAVTSVYETTPQPYYRVLEFIPGGPGPDVMVNGGFETADANNVGAANWNAPASNGTVNQYATNQYDVFLPNVGTKMLFIEGQGGSASLVESDLLPITGGLTYKVVFDAANPMKSGGGNPQFRIQFFAADGGYISESGFTSVASAGSSWVTFSNNYAAPANAATLRIGFLQAVGAGPTDHWISLIDNITVSALATIASTNVLSPTLQLGAFFIGTVQTNGVTATSATGTISFQTNSVHLSTNTVAAGSASSATGILTPPYTVTAIYSGDSTFIGSTNTLTVNNAVATVSLSNLSQTYDGTAKSVLATTTPGGLNVALTYNGAAEAPVNAGTYEVVATVVDALYVGSTTNSLVIGKAAAVVSLDNLLQTYNGTPRNATATTTPAGLTVDYTYDGLPDAPTAVGTYIVVGTVVSINYQGSATNNLVIVEAVDPTPTNIVSSVSGNQLTLSWPAGWTLQSQTNSLAIGISSNWYDVEGSAATNEMTFAIDPANQAVFYRLKFNP